MDQESNEAALRKFYKARVARDRAALDEAIDEFFTSSAAWYVPGRGDLSGEYRGRERIKGFFRGLDERAGGTLVMHLVDVMASGHYGVVIEEPAVERAGKTYGWREVVVFRFEPDGIAEARVYTDDQVGLEWFWSPAAS